MTIDLKDFIKKYREEINNKKFEEVYSSAGYELHYKNVGKLTELLYRCGVDPLKYMTEVPNTYAYESSIRSIVIPNNIVSIGVSAFDRCASLTSVTIGSSVITIKSLAFRGCSSLKSIIIPDSVTGISASAFSGCTSLTSVNISDSVTWIGTYAFNNCSSLTSVTIGDSVASIGDEVFRGCSSLTSIAIPDSMSLIGWRVFSDCSSLKSINYKGSKNQWNNLSKDTQWERGSSIETVHCTDGDIEVGV